MSDTIFMSVCVCGLSLIMTLVLIRSTRISLGLPFAYLCILYLNHLPGALAHLVQPGLFDTTHYVAIGMTQTAVGSSCFVLGLLLAQRGFRPRQLGPGPITVNVDLTRYGPASRQFWLFCLIGGWVFVYALAPLTAIPSFGAIVEKGGAVWVLGVMLGLVDATARKNLQSTLGWSAALAVYPVLMLLLGGFLSYGSSAAIIATSILAANARSLVRALLAVVVSSALGLTVFVNYFIARDQIRSVTWSSASFETRLDTVIDVFSGMAPLDFGNEKHALALDDRLNQNYFAGLAADRLEIGVVAFRKGLSFYEALIAPIPRAFWPDKPVFGGSGSIVREMTGLDLSETTSWGVGQVMEFYINYGWPSLGFGFLGLGWLLRILDLKAAAAAHEADIRSLLVCFLPAVAIIQPIGSLVELVGGACAAYIAATGWFYLWKRWSIYQIRH